MSEILVVDDERSMREFLEIMLAQEGHQVRTAVNMNQAIELVEELVPELVVTDLKMRGGSGIELLKTVKTRHPEIEVVVITAFASNQTAIEALKQGAYDYVTKPFQIDELKVVIQRALEKQRLLFENQRMRARLTDKGDFGDLVGKSPRMNEVYRLIERVAPTRSNVVITGESGTGKELVAKAIHTHSQRANGPFVPIDCASIPEQLMESELFGCVRGAFTGATTDRKGLFELARGGTVFLDEIGEIPTTIQVKLLRVLQERAIKRLGEANDRSVDVRVVTATNRDIEQEVQDGRFREDLFFRLNVIRIHLPALRERKEDIPELVRHFVKKIASMEERTAPVVLTEAMDALEAYDFPGNVRELQNMVERAVALSANRPIGAELFSDYFRKSEVLAKLDLDNFPDEGINLDSVLATVEKRLLQQALERTNGIRTEAAKLLHITFRSIRYRLLKHGLDTMDNQEP